MELIEALSWRYATKKFDTNKKVAESDIKILKEAIRLSASSYGLQPYKVVVIKDEELRQKLKPAANNQSQITDASHLFVFCYKTGMDSNYVEDYINDIAKVRKIEKNKLAGFKDTMLNKVNTSAQDKLAVWNSRQVYIALGNLLSACAEMKIDACPMEGFDPKQFNEILGLNEKGLSAVALTTVGYRSKDDALQRMAKVRKDDESLFITY